MKRSLSLKMHGDPSCTVLLRQCPPNTDESSIRQIFWNAEQIMSSDETTGTSRFNYYVSFVTPEEAYDALCLGTVNIAGEDIEVVVLDDSGLNMQKAPREVILPDLPPDTTVTELQGMFPGAASIRLQKHQDILRAFVKFPTAEEAAAAVQHGSLQLRGHDIPVQMGQGKLTAAQKRGEQKRRSVLLTGGRLGLTMEDVLEVFPEATNVSISQEEPLVIYFLLPSEEDAIQAGAQETIVIKGQPLNVKAQVRRDEYKQQSRAGAKQRTIVVDGCPPQTSKDDITAHFPTAEFIRFTNPDDYQNRMAFVVMPTCAIADATVVLQPTIHVHGSELRVYRTMEERDADEEDRTVIFKKCPRQVSDEDMRELFPNAIKMRRSHDQSKPKCTYIAVFGTVEETLDASRRQTISIHGAQVLVKRSDRNQPQPSKKSQPSKKRKMSHVDAVSHASVSAPHHVLPQPPVSYPPATRSMGSSYRPKAVPTASFHQVPKSHPLPFRPAPVPVSNPGYYRSSPVSPFLRAPVAHVPSMSAKRQMLHTADQPIYLQPARQLFHNPRRANYF